MRWSASQSSGVPLGRNLAGFLAEDALGDPAFEAFEPRLECLHAGHAVIDAVAGVQSAQGRIRKIPLPGVEAESEVDHHGLVAGRRVNAVLHRPSRP